MKRYSKVKSSVYAPVSTNCMAQHQTFLQMTNHYRRVYSAKKCVDTSPPHSYSKKHSKTVSPVQCGCSSTLTPKSTTASTKSTTSSGPSASELDLVNRIVNDSKHSPIAYVDDVQNCIVAQETSSVRLCTLPKKYRKQTSTGVQTPKVTAKKPPSCRVWSPKKERKYPPLDIIDQHPDYFHSNAAPYVPRILKTSAQPRVLDLRVYHPPRRRGRPNLKENTVSSQDSDKEDGEYSASPDVPHLEIEPDSDQEDWLVEQASRGEARQRAAKLLSHNGSIKTSSGVGPLLSRTSSGKESSKDSAYNGGISSGESRGPTRGPTPEHGISLEYHKSTGFIPEKEVKQVVLSDRTELKPPEKSVDDDIKYLRFLKEVTEDILVRGVYTNRSLKQIFQSHVDANRGKLDLDRMLMLIERLSIDLGIPEDDSLDDLNYGLGYVDSKSKLAVFDGVDSTKPSSLADSLSTSKCSLISGGSQCHVDSSKISKPKYSLKGGRSKTLLDIKEQDICSVNEEGVDELSMSKTDVLHTLKEVGFDSTMASEIYQVLQKIDGETCDNEDCETTSPADGEDNVSAINRNQDKEETYESDFCESEGDQSVADSNNDDDDVDD